MALASATAENAAVNGITALTGHFISGHTASPSTTGANEASGGSYARVSGAWGSASAGVAANTGTVSVNIPASNTWTHFGDWSAITTGTYYIGLPLSPNVTTGTSAGAVTAAIGALTLGAT